MAVEIIPRKRSSPRQSTVRVAPLGERMGRSGAWPRKLLQPHRHGGIDALTGVCLEQIPKRLAGRDQAIQIPRGDGEIRPGDLAEPLGRELRRPEVVDPIRQLCAVDELLDERKRSRRGSRVLVVVISGGSLATVIVTSITI